MDTPGERTQESDAAAAKVLEIHPDLVVLGRYAPETGEVLVVAANPATARLLGVDAAKLIGRPVRTLLADQSPFLTREQRDAFHRQVQARGQTEFPGLAQVRDERGQRRQLRVRLCWPAGSEYCLYIGEDVSRRTALDEHAGAGERLRSAVEVGGLLSHHVNNALTAAQLNLAFARREAAGHVPSDTIEALDAAREALDTAAQVVAALAATTGVETEVRETCELEPALRAAAAHLDLDNLALSIDGPGGPCHVWGARAQVEMVFAGVLSPLCAGEAPVVRATIECDEHEVRVELETGASAESWMRVLLDPSEPQPSADTRSLRLFSSIQMLQAIGGELGLPSWDADGLSVQLRLRLAPGQVTHPPPAPPVLLVSGDGALRAVAGALLDGWTVRYTQNIREGLIWLMRPRGGIVICDLDELEIPLHELIALQRLVTGGDTRRLILATRKPPTPGLQVPQIAIPFPAGELEALVGKAMAE